MMDMCVLTVRKKAFFLLYLLVSQSPINIVQAKRVIDSEMHHLGVSKSPHNAQTKPDVDLDHQRKGNTAAQSDLSVELLSGNLQYKFRNPGMSGSSGYKEARLVLAYDKQGKSLKLHALVGGDGIDSQKHLEGTAGLPIDEKTRIEIMQDRGSRGPRLMLHRGNDSVEYVKIRAPRIAIKGGPYLKSGTGVTWLSSVPKVLTLVRGPGSENETVAEFTGSRRASHILETFGRDLEMIRQFLYAHPCVLSGTCLDSCQPPATMSAMPGRAAQANVTGAGPVACQPQYFCQLNAAKDKCEPVVGDSPITKTWQSAVSSLAVKLTPAAWPKSRFKADKEKFEEILGEMTFLHKIQELVGMLSKDHVWNQKLPSFVAEVRKGELNKVREALATILEGLGVVEEEAKAEFGCEISPIRLKDRSNKDRIAELERTLDQCPQLEDGDQEFVMTNATASHTGESEALVQRESFHGEVALLDPLSWAIIITASALLIFHIGAHLTKHSTRFKWTNVFFRVMRGITLHVLAVELVILSCGGLSAVMPTVIAEWGTLTTMWTAEEGPGKLRPP
eukprot:gnl/MRDRNA2_/MRDRNA2_82884_c0_seq2.p1 gnl/MRDRNA2_/MRDRNA2_82884_c0~~gnl/MRDRNA2_/MRDRNA2_82884_c0_seq2.p1  ORF type:complete len:562 (-),score=105.54 gnl/MRDRNA2_/MRDRNA2_82884_c0_seq2:259-1944(-)